MSSGEAFQNPPSLTFQRAVDRFTKELSARDAAEFANTNLEDVYTAVKQIQERRGNSKTLRDMRRVQAFLEAMDEYRKVIEAFLNCTPFMGYVWGPIRYILLVADTWVKSLDTILDAYKEIEERLPSFIKYKTLFETDPEMQYALELYFCDILEFHFHALKFLTRSGWKKLFESAWKTFNTEFRRILDSLNRHKTLIESGKGTLAIIAAQKAREAAEASSKVVIEREKNDRLSLLSERLDQADLGRDQYTASQEWRQTRSGQWLWQDEPFRRWCDLSSDSNPLMYLHGVPGAGKTVLVSHIVETIQQIKPEPVLYYYCKHDEPKKNRFDDILRSLLIQLAYRDDALATRLHDSCASKNSYSILSILEALGETAFESQQGCFVIIDGLDECLPVEAERIMSWMISQSTKGQQEQGDQTRRMRLLFAGQRTHVLQHMLHSATKISLDSHEHELDIKSYVEKAATRLKEQFELDAATRTRIVDSICARATSMFLFAKLVVENLLNQATKSDLLYEIEPSVLPSGLGDAYHRICETVFCKGHHRKQAVEIFGLTICAARKLRWREIQAFFFTDPELGTCDFDGRRLRKGCKEFCGSLIDLHRSQGESENEAFLEIVHPTAREYLESHEYVDVVWQHSALAKWCLQYLLSPPLSLNIPGEETLQRAKAGYFAFHEYASAYWHHHVLFASSHQPTNNHGVIHGLEALLQQFLERNATADVSNLPQASRSPSTLSSLLARLPEIERDRHKHPGIEELSSRIRRHIESLAEQLVPQTPEQPTFYSMYGTRIFRCPRLDCEMSLQGFSTRVLRDEHLNRHDRPFLCVQQGCPFQSLGFVTEQQLEKHARDSHSKLEDNEIQFPQAPAKHSDTIYKAASRGDVDAIRVLIKQDVDVNLASRPNGSLTPLILAARGSHLQSCQILLDAGSNINHKSRNADSGGTALHIAVWNEDIELVALLLARQDLDAHSTDVHNRTPLDAAACRGQLALAKMLLNSSKVNANRTGNQGDRTVLNYACDSDFHSHEMLELLLPHVSQEVVVQSFSYATQPPANLKLIRFLIAHDAIDINACNNEGLSLLSIAKKTPTWDVLKMLIEHPKIIMSASDWYDLLLNAKDASSWETCRMLIQHPKLDMGPVEGFHYGVSFSCALVAADQVDLVKTLIEHPNINMSAGDWYDLLLKAKETSSWETCRMLIQHPKLDIGPVEGPYSYAVSFLGALVATDQVDIVELLLAMGKVDPNQCDNNDQPPLSTAIRNGNGAMIDALLKTGKIELNARNSQGETMLSWAIRKGRTKEIEWLLNTKGVDLTAVDASGRSAMELAQGLYDEAYKLDLAIEADCEGPHNYDKKLMLLERRNKESLLLGDAGVQYIRKKILHMLTMVDKRLFVPPAMYELGELSQESL